MRMSPILLLAALLSTAGVAAAGISYEFTFDDVATGTAANALPQPPALGVSFYNAEYTPDLDPQGDPIPGTEKWRIDNSAPTVIVDNPNNYGRGDAPSPLNALEALFQPVLVLFPAPFDIDPAGLSMVLDLDTFGTNGLLPGNEQIAVQFLNAASSLISSVRVDQTTPGYVVNAGPVTDVSAMLLPAGAFYDNLSISGVPEPTSLALLAIGAAAASRRRR